MPVPKQPIPHLGSRLQTLVGPVLLVILAVGAQLARASEPPRRIPLEDLGYEPLSTQFLLAGASMLTVDYVDQTHLLITFHVRRLMHRLPDDPPEDQDRNVDAVLYDLPSARILARTSWRLHDHGQYLWNIGDGRFLLRVRDTLTVFAPLANLDSGTPFREHPFLNTKNRRMAQILISPDDSLITVETVKREPLAASQKPPLSGFAPPSEPEPTTEVQMNFYRIPEPRNAADDVRPRYAGVAHTNTTGSIPTLDAGYLDVIDEGDGRHWAFDFDAYSGKKKELAEFDSTCRPAPFFVSRSEFIAFGCHGGSNRQILGGFNMGGEEVWQQNLFNDYVSPTLAFAPARGRFVLSRVMVHTAAGPTPLAAPEQIGAQTIVVYQTSSGRQLLRAECSPVEPAGQNFALSPDGSSVATVHNDAIEIYKLPEPNAAESADMKLALASAPADTGDLVHFSESQQSLAASETRSDSLESPNRVDSLAQSSQAPGEAPAQAGDSGATAANAAIGDPPPDQPRPRPTLYTLPDDPPHPEQNQPPPHDQPK